MIKDYIEFQEKRDKLFKSAKISVKILLFGINIFWVMFWSLLITKGGWFFVYYIFICVLVAATDILSDKCLEMIINNEDNKLM